MIDAARASDLLNGCTVRLRRVTLEEAEECAVVYCEDGSESSEDAARGRAAEQAGRGLWRLESRLDHELLGLVELDTRGEPVIRLHPDHRSQGLGTETCWLLGAGHALPERLRLTLDQHGARRMAERCGYRLVDDAEGYQLEARADQDQRIGELTRYFDQLLEQRLAGYLADIGLPDGYTERLPRVPEARSLVRAGNDCFDRPLFLTGATLDAWRAMAGAAAGDGITLEPVSGFRDVDYQHELIRRKLDRGNEIEEILAVSAAPGFSEHHGGFALDLGTPGCKPLEAEFEHSAAHAWLVAHSTRFGFVKSFPEGNPHGIAHEPWHWALASARP